MIKITAVASIFFDTRVVLYGMTYFVSHSITQFISTFFGTLYSTLGTKHMSTTAYHAQTNRQVERYNKTTVARLRQYVATHQRDWNFSVQSLNYGYNAEAHLYDYTTLFCVVPTKYSSWPATSDNSSELATDANDSTDLLLLETPLLAHI